MDYEEMQNIWNNSTEPLEKSFLNWGVKIIVVILIIIFIIFFYFVKRNKTKKGVKL